MFFRSSDRQPKRLALQSRSRDSAPARPMVVSQSMQIFTLLIALKVWRAVGLMMAWIGWRFGAIRRRWVRHLLVVDWFFSFLRHSLFAWS